MTSANRVSGNRPVMISRQHPARVVLCALVAGLLSVPVGTPAEGRAQDEGMAPERDRGRPAGLDEQAPAVRGPVPIRPPRATPLPPEGHGRLSITFDGNRRWCTFPDDRLQRAPVKAPRGPKRRRDVFTFGYQFSVAAVKHSQPDATLLLYSSPVIRTASLRQAGKLGRGQTLGQANSKIPIVVPDGHAPSSRRARESPAALVPYWDEAQRCAMVGEQFDFDLGPGLYDVYLSFDIMIRSGAWVHRTYAYLTDIEIAEASRTLVDGMIDMGGGGRRDLKLRSASIGPLPGQGAARP